MFEKSANCNIAITYVVQLLMIYNKLRCNRFTLYLYKYLGLYNKIDINILP